jgi:integrase
VVFRRKGSTTYAFQARQPNGTFRQMQTPAPLTAQGKGLALRMAAMWESLAVEHRAWDLLTPILEAKRAERIRKLGRLYDLWTETRGNLTAVRRLLADIDIEPYVEPYLLAHSQSVGAGTAAHVRLYLRWLIPAGRPYLLSAVTPGWLTGRLSSYPKAGRSTRRHVASAWSGFLEHLTRVHGLWVVNPMQAVKRTTPKKAPVAFSERATVERIIGAQPTEARRVLCAILYGTGIEVSVALRLRRSDVWDVSQEINAAGTKTHTRHRVASVEDWAWPMIRDYAKNLLPTARLFPPEWTTQSVSQWHLRTVRVWLKLPEVLRLHAARHHWAVTNLRAGVPVAVVQSQLGHASASMTLDVYGAFLPTGADRKRWRAQVAKAEAERAETGDRSAPGGAKAGGANRAGGAT